MPQPTLKTVNIASAASLSAQVDIGPLTLCGIIMPAAWTAAALSVQVSFDGGTTWMEMFDKAAAIAIAAAQGIYIALDPALFKGCTSLKIRSGTSGSPVAQGAARDLILVTAQV